MEGSQQKQPNSVTMVQDREQDGDARKPLAINMRDVVISRVPEANAKFRLLLSKICGVYAQPLSVFRLHGIGGSGFGGRSAAPLRIFSVACNRQDERGTLRRCLDM
jgi:hypothetical protein